MRETERSTSLQAEATRQAVLVGQNVAANSVLFVALGIYLIIVSPTWHGYAIMLLASQSLIGGFVSARLIRVGQQKLGGWVMLITTLLAPMLASLVITQLGYVAIAYILLAVYFIIRFVISPELQRQATVISGLALLVPLAAEIANPAWRLVSELVLILTPIFTGLLGLVFVVIVIRQAWTGNIRTRLVTSLLGLGLLPLVISGAIASLTIRQSALSNVYEQLSSATILKENSVDTWLNTMINTLDIIFHGYEEAEVIHTMLGLESVLPDSTEAHDPEAEPIDTLANTTRDLKAIVAKTDVFEEIFIIDHTGKVAISTDENQVGKVFANQPVFQEGLKGKFVQPPQFSQSLGQIAIYVARPLADEHGHSSGVVVGRANLDILDEIMLADIGVGQTGETYLVRSNNTLLTASKFPGYVAGDTYIRTEGVNTAIREQQNGTAVYDGYRNTVVLSAYRWLPELQLALMAEVEQSEALNAAFTSTVTTVGVAAGAAVVALVVAFYVTQSIATPLGELAGAAEKFATGELDTTVEVSRQDEIGTLAESFNSMADQLRQTLQGLENQVADRTRALETSTEVSRRLSTILDPTQLVREVVEQLQSAFGFYHAHIYLFDESKRKLELVGGTGEAGQTMMARHHAIIIGQGLVGQAAQANKIVLIPDVTQAQDWLPNPLLPETKSEVAVPIAIGPDVLGVLDVQHNITEGITEQDANLIQAIGAQMAIAIQNAQAYTRAQNQARREAAIASIGQHIQSASTVDDVLQVAIRELGQVLDVDRANVELSVHQEQN